MFGKCRAVSRVYLTGVDMDRPVGKPFPLTDIWFQYLRRSCRRMSTTLQLSGSSPSDHRRVVSSPTAAVSVAIIMLHEGIDVDVVPQAQGMAVVGSRPWVKTLLLRLAMDSRIEGATNALIARHLLPHRPCGSDLMGFF